MAFEDQLSANRSKILKKWFQAIVDTYPPETARFLKKEKDPFANPVGSSILEGIEGIYDALFEEIDPAKVSPFLDRVIRVRAVQDFKPSEALVFIFLLKGVIRDALSESIDVFPEAFQRLEGRIDRLALISFNIYMECREKLYELRVDEIKNRTARLLQRADFIWETYLKEREPQEDS